MPSSAPDTAADQSPSLRRSAGTMVGLLLAGVALWAWVDRGDVGSGRTAWAVAAAMATLAIPAVRRVAADVPRAAVSKGVPFGPTIGVAVLAAAYFAASALWQGRDLGPHAHDDLMYLTQASQLAAGHLWSAMPADVADFFDSPYLIVRPVYAALSWPGTALAYAPGARLGVAPWCTAAVLAGAAVAAVFHVAREMAVRPAGAALAAVLVAVGRPFHTVSVTVNSHVPVLLAGGVAAVAAIRWWRGGRRGWAGAFGAAAGWAAVCRPVDAVCLLLPVVLAAAAGRPRRRRSAAGLAKAAGIAAAAAAPFLALQLAFDRGVTGRWLDTPFAAYCRRDYPQVTYGFPPYDPSARPASVVRQKSDLYDGFAVPFVVAHQPGRWLGDWAANRLPAAFRGGQPAPLLLVLVPLGAVSLVRRRGRWGAAVVAPLPLFCLLYAPYTIFLPTYAVLCGPAVAACALAGVMSVAGRFPTAWGRAVVVAAAVGVALASVPEVNGGSDDPARPAGAMAARALDGLIRAPRRALVLVRYHPGNPVGDEPVYNWTVATPDDARVVLAHDLGWARDAGLIRHYALTQPDRRVYLLDRADYRLRDLGTAADLARRPPVGFPPWAG